MVQGLLVEEENIIDLDDVVSHSLEPRLKIREPKQAFFTFFSIKDKRNISFTARSFANIKSHRNCKFSTTARVQRTIGVENGWVFNN